MKGGWVKIWRQLEDWEYFNDPIRLRAWLVLIFWANRLEDDSSSDEIKANIGQIVTTYSELSYKFRCSKTTAVKVLKDFERSNQIRTMSERRKTLITICNYDSYQGINKDVRTMYGTISGTINDTINDTINGTPIYIEENKEDKKKNIIKSADAQNPKKPAQKSNVIFKKPTVEEIKAYATEKGRPDFDANMFYNYYESNGWKVGRNPMKKWQNTVAMWISREQKGVFNKPNNSGNGTKQPITDDQLTAAVKIGINLAETKKLLEEN